MTKVEDRNTADITAQITWIAKTSIRTLNSEQFDYRDAYTLKNSKLIHNFSCNNHLIPGYYNTVALICQMTALQYLFSFVLFCGA